MNKLVAISPIGKNGQTVVPASIRRMFKITAGHNMVGFYIAGTHVEIAPIDIQKSKVEYTVTELDKLARLAREKGGKKCKTAACAKQYLKSI
jgi:bifunctional DNA-binding transcriptional regulator/antitoxin component of YhaV-PrlF toxin-antitoxin module